MDKSSPSVAFYTLGCRLNQVESEAVSLAFGKAGFDIAGQGAPFDLLIVNTCTVTSKSEQKGRRIIRKASSENPRSLIIVTGCYAQLDGGNIEKLGNNILVIKQQDKNRLLELPLFIKELAGKDPADMKKEISYRLDTLVPETSKFDFLPDTFNFHTRASLKIQDGCDNFCSYCRIPYARGRSESMDFDRALSAASAIEKNGYKELILTGVNISDYKAGERRLKDLVAGILENTNDIRIRLSSLGPYETDESFGYFASEKRVCPYFHLSVQSGSDRILADMGRRYSSDRIKVISDILKKSGRDPFISCDVITGYPGETEDDFLDSCRIIEECGFASCHVFPFSPRPGTRAFSLKGRIPERISCERAHCLAVLSEKQHRNYIKRQEGRSEKVIIEKELYSAGKKYYAGLSSNYLKVMIDGGADLKTGSLCRVTLKVEEDSVFGIL